MVCVCIYIYIYICIYIMEYYSVICYSQLLRSGGRPRGDTQRPRSGAATRGVTLRPKSGAAAGRRYPTPQARGQGRWPGDQPHVQGAVAARAQEGLEELSHVESQEGRQ